MNANEFLWQCGGDRALFEQHFGENYRYKGNNPDVIEELKTRGCDEWIRDGKCVVCNEVIVVTLQIRWAGEYNYIAVREACRRNDIKLMQEIVKLNLCPREIAIMTAHEDNLEMTKFLASAGFRGFEMSFITSKRDVEWFKIYYEAGAKFDPIEDMHSAITWADLEILKFLHSIGGVLDAKLYKHACGKKRLEILKYMEECKCPRADDACDAAASVNSIPTLEYLTQCGCPLKSLAFAKASELSTFKWLVEHKCPISNGAIDSVLYLHESIETLTTLEYLASVGCSLDDPHKAIWDRISHLRNYTYMKWYLDRLPLDVEMRKMACSYGNSRRNAWLYEFAEGKDPADAAAFFTFMAIHFGTELASFIASCTQKPCSVTVDDGVPEVPEQVDEPHDFLFYQNPPFRSITLYAAYTGVIRLAEGLELGISAIVAKYKYPAFTYTYRV